LKIRKDKRNQKQLNKKKKVKRKKTTYLHPINNKTKLLMEPKYKDCIETSMHKKMKKTTNNTMKEKKTKNKRK
jgi:chromosome segregation and condensation protein ScpB